MRVVYLFPFRNTRGQGRDYQLNQCIRALTSYCAMHRVEFEYVVGEHEEDGNKFNRGQAINVAAVWSI
jgi:hypothetical protein